MTEDWLARWQDGRIGWHEDRGNAAMQRHWPANTRDIRVLVPLCGKSVDLAWLASRGCTVTGVELSPLAARAFFAEQGLAFYTSSDNGMTRYAARDAAIEIFCGDYFAFGGGSFDALYDRGALIAMPASRRRAYVTHTDRLLQKDALRMVITLEYRQKAADGPPYAVMPEEVQKYWPELREMDRRNDIDNAPPRFRNAGLAKFVETLWLYDPRSR